MLPRDQAADLVEHFGGVRAAARGADIEYRELWYSLNPERARDMHRAASQRYRDKNSAALAAKQHDRRENWRDQGLCTRCGQEPRLGESVCWACLNDMEERRSIALS